MHKYNNAKTVAKARATQRPHIYLRAYDSGPFFADRYTVLRLDWIGADSGLVESFHMSADPFHPQGFGQHGSSKPGRHLGKRIRFADLPEACQKAASHFAATR